MNFKTPYSGNERLQFTFNDVSLTDQSFKDECDIGFIIKNFVQTGQQPDSTMSFVDCTTVKSFEDSMQIVAEAKSNFNALPSSIRDEFKTVSNYLAYISDANNLRDSYERGLIDRGSVSLNDVYADYSSVLSIDMDKLSDTELSQVIKLDLNSIKAQQELLKGSVNNSTTTTTPDVINPSQNAMQTS